MDWNKEQKLAIDTRDKNILVAAAAGSGKTTLLVERIKKLIIDDHVSIDRMLVVTFTNAAASEMREKIIKTINLEIEMGEEKGEDTSFLRAQLDIIHRANISTFHSFGLEIIRENFSSLGLEPGFGICTEAEKTIFLERAIDQVLDHRFEIGDKAFLELANAFGSYKGEKAVRELIKSAYTKLMGLPNPWQWIEEKIDAVEHGNSMDADSEMTKAIKESCQKNLDYALQLCEKAEELLRDNNLLKLFTFAMGEETQIKNAKERFEKEQLSFDQMGQIINDIQFGRMTASKDEKEGYALIKDKVKVYRDMYKKAVTDLSTQFFYDSLENINTDLKATVPMQRCLKSLVEELHQNFMSEKRAKNLLDFTDIEHYALEALADEKIASAYREKFLHIFVDEYQDSNMVQEAIIGRICKENNRFLVGDVKQSIYRFRLAEPEIFNQRYREFGQDNVNSIKIDLNMNYRSKGNVIDSVNLFFKELMDGYGDEAALHKGDSYEGPFDYKTELHIVEDTKLEPGEMDEAIIELERVQKEAIVAVKLIRENLGKPIWDSKLKKERPLQKKDIVILMRSVQNWAQTFYDVLMDQNIPAYIDSSDGYFDTIEINNMINLLTVIDNKQQDVPLIGVLHSEIFSFSLDDLIDVRIEFKYRPFYQALMDYASEGKKDYLREKCQKALDKIAYWKVLSYSMPLDKFIWTLMMESGYYIAVGALPGGVQRQANLRSLVDKATTFQSNGNSSLFSFISYINAVMQEKVQTGQVKLVGEKDDLVRIMTIHKSKGLEFPVVIVAGMAKGFNNQGDKVNFHKDFGIGLPLVNYKEHWKKSTILERVIKAQNRKEEMEEQIRVLYVALTRAKDKLILLGTPSKLENLKENIETGITTQSSYLDMVATSAVNSRTIPYQYHSSAEISQRYIAKRRKLDQILSLFDNEEHIEDKELAQEVEKRVNFVYPYEDSLDIRSKYSVSELNKKDGDKQYPYVAERPKFMGESPKFTGAQKGTIYHCLMEHLAFEGIANDDKMDIQFIQETVAELVDKEILSTEEASQVDVRKVLPFFRSDIGERAVKAAKDGKLVKEKAFTYAMDVSLEQVMVQGIIDCFFEEDGKLVLIDYKTNYINEWNNLEEEIERVKGTYQTQMDIYKKALEEGKGMEVKEAYLYLHYIGQFVAI